MRMMRLNAPHQPLEYAEGTSPILSPSQVRIGISACGVCRTDLHLVDGELPNPKLPVVPGHQIVGIVDAVGPGVARPRTGDRVGVPWLGGSCGACEYCRSGRENLCDAARFT